MDHCLRLSGIARLVNMLHGHNDTLSSCVRPFTDFWEFGVIINRQWVIWTIGMEQICAKFWPRSSWYWMWYHWLSWIVILVCITHRALGNKLFNSANTEYPWLVLYISHLQDVIHEFSSAFHVSICFADLKRSPDVKLISSLKVQYAWICFWTSLLSLAVFVTAYLVHIN